MGVSILQQTIAFIANKLDKDPSTIDGNTTFGSLGIYPGPDTKEIIMELEDHFNLIYVNGDEDGITTVGGAANMITNKLGA